MSSRIANTAAKIPAASSGPRQLSTVPSPDLLSNMAEELPLILAIRSDPLCRHRMRPVPNTIELPQAAAQFLRDFRPRLDRCLRTPAPPAGKLIEIFAIRAIAANRQPLALRQSRKQTEVRRAKREAQFAFPFQPACQREPFILGALTRRGTVAQIRNRRDCERDGKRRHLPSLPQPKEHPCCHESQNRD